MEEKRRNYDILWDQIEIQPSIQLKTGIIKRTFPLTKQFTGKRDKIYYVNKFIELEGKWDNSPKFGSLLSLKLKNIHSQSIRLARLIFPMENGLDYFIKSFNPADISFLRNGYQSWSTTRSYSFKDKPLRPWLIFVSLTSSNMANLPSNIPGNLSSEMFSVITDTRHDKSFLVGQTSPFNQFLYIKLILNKTQREKSHFSLIYDFGRKIIYPGQTIQLDGILMAEGETVELQRNYFSYLQKTEKIKIPQRNLKGWCTWYYYYNKIKPDDIVNNLKIIKQKKLPFDFIQIDDGYQIHVGDWLELKPDFKDRMKELADTIKARGYIPGIWLAPFIAAVKSNLVRSRPDFLLRTEQGKAITAGYSPDWVGNFFYALDITNPRVEEYIRQVVRIFVHEWGFKYLKLDFLYGGCMRGGNHVKAELSRAEVLKHGLTIIKEEAGKDVFIAGCGMPLSPGIGFCNSMRVGPDTAPVWRKIIGHIFRTGAMLGARNSMRNFMVRSPMNKKIWVNDPDCIMLRKTNTKLNEYERRTQINAIILAGGMLMFSDDLEEVAEGIMDDIGKIIELSDDCYKGEALPLDVMERELPSIYYNTAGYIGFFNFHNKQFTMVIDLKEYFSMSPYLEKMKKLIDVWSGEVIEIMPSKILIFQMMKPHSSRLFKIVYS